ncbi:hypothetical protein ACJMK2_018454 [Sinanodonta woodiana]|uniref:VWFD domain-containing protein n=1 Tax=Sinanodonta woodiana TaxID=1069815 RepID=A0ABD3UDG7_SINWO
MSEVLTLFQTGWHNIHSHLSCSSFLIGGDRVKCNLHLSVNLVWSFYLNIKYTLNIYIQTYIRENCDGTHMTLPQLEKRTSNYSANKFGYGLSDFDLTNGWYDVGRNNMPTDPSSIHIHGDSCRAYHPIWMNGTIPSARDGKVIRTACYQTEFSVCNYAIEIQVINCGTHMLYNLRSTYEYYFLYLYYYYNRYGLWNGNAYHSVYCFDPSELTDSLNVQPRLFFADEKGVHRQIFKKPKLMFCCQMNGNMTDDLYYSVTWYVNDVFLVSKGPVRHSSIDDTILYESELLERGYKLDININCIMNISNSSEGSPDNSTTSPHYWLGIRVLNPSVNIIQGSSTTIQLQPTFPFGCSSRVDDQNPQTKCLLSVHMFDPNDSNDCKGSSISVTGSQKCGVQIPGFYYHEWRDGVRYDNVTEMTITTRDPKDYQEGRTRFELKLLTEGTGLNDIIQGSYISNIIVTTSSVTSWQGKTCYSYVDPHMRSYDGRRCNNVATCACAVAVRAGGDIFLIDLCGTPGVIKHVSCKENILDVRQISPYMYQIYMPLRTMVSVTINTWWGYESTLNVNIYPSVKDVHQTQGLCGVINDNPGDDFTTPSGNIEQDNNEFSLSWRIHEADSFFDYVNHDPGVWDENALFCVCPAALNTATLPNTSSGSKFDPICSASLSLSCSTKDTVRGKPYETCNIRSKRSKQSFSKEIERILRRKFVDNDIKSHNVEKRSTQNITLEEALDECTSFFSNNCTTAMFEAQLPNSNQKSMNSSITNCALDYTYTGDMALASLHCETYRSEVDEEIERNSTFREANPDVVNSFHDMACINDCNNHGICVNGSCICHAQYIDVDCSVSLNRFPEVEDTYSGGLCQKEMDDCCGEVPIYGTRFVQGVTKQRLEIFNIYINGTEVIEDPILKVIDIINPYEAHMDMPCHRRQRSTDSDNSSISFILGTRVSLTNDGINYGPAKSYYILDSKCQGILNGSNGYTFYLLDGTCFISGTCYSERETNSLNGCQQCQPNLDRFSWTYNCTSTNDHMVVQGMTPVIVAVCVGTLVIILVIVTVNIIKCCLKKGKRIAGQFEINVPATTVAPRTFDKTLLFCSQQSLREYRSHANEHNVYTNHRTAGNRPSTPGSLSFQKVFLEMELPEKY